MGQKGGTLTLPQLGSVLGSARVDFARGPAIGSGPHYPDRSPGLGSARLGLAWLEVRLGRVSRVFEARSREQSVSDTTRGLTDSGACVGLTRGLVLFGTRLCSAQLRSRIGSYYIGSRLGSRLGLVRASRLDLTLGFGVDSMFDAWLSWTLRN